ncbi:MAG: phenylalanine--tRNA ligase subunit alpha [Anaerolineae bacterium]|nr:phenylalanine--tRNA ligase subunit alpha [Anaerolineae bacterium]
MDALQATALEALQQTTTSEASEAWYRDYLGRNGQLTGVLRKLGGLPKDERPAVGQRANEVKQALESALENRQTALAHSEMEAALSAEGVDVTLPGRPVTLGKLHPTTVTMREITDILGGMGFQVFDSPEVETDAFNFELLNFPPGHPAQDGFVLHQQVRRHPAHPHQPGRPRHAQVCARAHPGHPAGQVLPQRRCDRALRDDVLPGGGVGRGAQHHLHRSQGRALELRQSDVTAKGRRIRFRSPISPSPNRVWRWMWTASLCGGEGANVCKYSGWLEILKRAWCIPSCSRTAATIGGVQQLRLRYGHRTADHAQAQRGRQPATSAQTTLLGTGLGFQFLA